MIVPILLLEQFVFLLKLQKIREANTNQCFSLGYCAVDNKFQMTLECIVPGDLPSLISRPLALSKTFSKFHVCLTKQRLLSSLHEQTEMRLRCVRGMRYSKGQSVKLIPTRWCVKGAQQRREFIFFNMSITISHIQNFKNILTMQVVSSYLWYSSGFIILLYALFNFFGSKHKRNVSSFFLS